MPKSKPSDSDKDKTNPVPAKGKPTPEPASSQPKLPQRVKSQLRIPNTKRDWLLISGVILAALIILFAVPYTRYGLIGQVIKRPITIDLADGGTHQPVSDAQVTIGNTTVKTNAKGEAVFGKVPVGNWQVVASKRYYALQNSNIMVPLFGKAGPYQVSLTAIGNQITVKVINKITGRALAQAKIAALGTTATTDNDGQAAIVLPTGKPSVDAKVSLDGYNDLSIAITNSENAGGANVFGLLPSGRIYYLDKRTGKINVMKANLDGSDPQVVLAGTGKESDTDTVLVSTRDWKYLGLKASRDSSTAKLYLINTQTDKLSLIDQGDAEFDVVGWYDHYFVYTVQRHNTQPWQPNAETIKSFNADTGKITSLASTTASGTNSNDARYEYFSQPGFLGDKVVFSIKQNGAPGTLAGQQDTIQAISPDGSGSTSLYSVDASQKDIENLVVAKPNLIYFSLYAYFAQQNNETYYQEDANKHVTPLDSAPPGLIDRTPLPYYLLSPGEKQTFWSEARDGKNTLFIGDQNGANQKEIASLSDYKPYGWYTDDYLLVSKDGSELYIAPADFSSPPLKVTNYHKPSVTFNGYGGGYGGQ